MILIGIREYINIKKLYSWMGKKNDACLKHSDPQTED